MAFLLQTLIRGISRPAPCAIARKVRGLASCTADLDGLNGEEHTSSKTTAVSVNLLNDHIRVAWADGHQSEYLYMWLRDHCPQSHHQFSLQRQIDTASIPADIRPDTVLLSKDEQKMKVSWTEGDTHHESIFDFKWLRDNCYSEQERINRRIKAKLATPWDRKSLANSFVSVGYDDLVSDSRDYTGIRLLVRTLLTDGAVIVHDVPPTREATAEVCELIGPIRRTFYADSIWDTKPKALEDVNDTAYTSLELKPHTDCTYLKEPPAIQAFHCVEQAAEGGNTWVVDGFKVAEIMKRDHPEAFRFFVDTPLPFQAIEEGVHVVATSPVFELDSDGNICKFRLNNDDRAPLRDLSAAKIHDFYKHIPTLLACTRNLDLAVTPKLDIGDMLIVQNQRVMHGRFEFEGFRNMLGCYMNADELESKARLLGLML